MPSPRGPCSAQLLAHLRRPPHDVGTLPDPDDDPVFGEDSALALYACYELHYRGFAGVDERWEWEPSLLGVRRRLEDAFERRLVEEIGPVPRLDPGAVRPALQALAGSEGGPSLSARLERAGTLSQLREFAVQRSLYQLKEADPHTWAIPRLTGVAKAAMVDIQTGEYGGGQLAGMHSVLFEQTLVGLGLDPRYGYYLDHVPGPAIATTNLVSLLGLHRRWRAALVGHLALFEMCSVVPMTRYRNALGRLGLDLQATRFYQEHVLADQGHQVVALEVMAAGLAAAEPDLAGQIVFGARALDAVEARFTRHLLDSWDARRTSLRKPLSEGLAA